MGMAGRTEKKATNRKRNRNDRKKKKKEEKSEKENACKLKKRKINCKWKIYLRRYCRY